MRKIIFCLAILTALCAMPLAGAVTITTVTLNPVKDNTVFESITGDTNQRSSGAGTVLFSGRNNTPIKTRALMAFDLSTIPTTATVTTVSLRLNLTTAGSATVYNMSLSTVSLNWGEGSSVSGGGAGIQSVAPDASWFYAMYNTVLWTNPGGDFSATPSATISIGNVAGFYTWTGSQMVADMKKWIASPSSNFGWVLTGNEAINQSVKQFSSRDAGTAGLRPLLTVVYTDAITPVELSSFKTE